MPGHISGWKESCAKNNGSISPYCRFAEDPRFFRFMDILLFFFSCFCQKETRMSRPRWIPDASSNRCAVTGFVFNRRHHCRVCGRIFCHACTSDRINIPRTMLRTMTPPEQQSKGFMQWAASWVRPAPDVVVGSPDDHGWCFEDEPVVPDQQRVCAACKDAVVSTISVEDLTEAVLTLNVYRTRSYSRVARPGLRVQNVAHGDDRAHRQLCGDPARSPVPENHALPKALAVGPMRRCSRGTARHGPWWPVGVACACGTPAHPVPRLGVRHALPTPSPSWFHSIVSLVLGTGTK